MNQTLKRYWQHYYNFYTTTFIKQSVIIQSEQSKNRDHLFISILIILAPILFVVYIPSVILSIQTNSMAIAIEDTIAIIILLYIYFCKQHSLLTKKILFSINIYLLAVVLLIFLGSLGPGAVFLISMSVFITLYLGKKAGIYSIAINFIVFFLLWLGAKYGHFSCYFFLNYQANSWLIVAINLLSFNTALVLSVSFLVDKLETSLNIQQKLSLKLKEESRELLVAKEKAEENDRLKSLFLANISHEIRTPMNGILGFTDLLKNQNIEDLKKEQYVNTIQQCGKRMLSTINDIIDIAKIDSGQTTLQKEKTNINENLTFLFNFFKLEADKKNIELVYNTTLSNSKALVIIDKEKLYGILTNLIKNAIKFTNEGRIEFGYTLNNTMLRFYVKDTGVGISDKNKHNIFERFIQDEESILKATNDGTGLGLAITKAYITMLDGKIWFDSEVNTGTSFYFEIPYIPVVE